jgi:uncharacterized membrane protein YqgA involved in biofilm formation
LIGLGTALNVLAVVVGGSVGAVLGQRLPERTQRVLTAALGLITLLVAGLNATAITDPVLDRATGRLGPVIVVLVALVLGGVIGSLLRVEDRLEVLGGRLRSRFVPQGGQAQPDDLVRFVDGFVTASLLFCVGPLTILGSLQDGLGLGVELLALKSVLDGIAALALASVFGWGVVASAGTVLVVQGGLTVVGVLLGDAIPQASILALTAVGGLLLLGTGLRLLGVARVPVADLLPALVIAPVLVALLAG